MDRDLMYDECETAGEIGMIGIALALFAKSICPGVFKKKSRTWIHDPCNFVAFQVRPAKRKLVLTLSGTYGRFSRVAAAASLSEDWSRNFAEARFPDYCAYEITNPSQLLLAVLLIKAALDNYKQHGRHRASASAAN
jgi:hypothetical protein